MHPTQDGETITRDYNSRHEPLATDEASPETLKTLVIAAMESQTSNDDAFA